MVGLFAGGRLIDAILAGTVLEFLALAAWHRATGRGLAPREVASTLLAGGFLLVALRLALSGAAWPLLALTLLGALGAHVFDVARRWR